MQMTCVKCGQHNDAATGAADDACPTCGAIYAKALARGARPVRPWSATTVPGSLGTASNFAPSRLDDTGPDTTMRDAYVTAMRTETLYPAFRATARFSYRILLAVAVVIAIGSLVSGIKGGGLFVAIVGVCGAVFFWVVIRAIAEASQMIADLSDATVRLAASREH